MAYVRIRRCVTTVGFVDANQSADRFGLLGHPLEKRGKIVSREQTSRRRQHGGKLFNELSKKFAVTLIM